MLYLLIGYLIAGVLVKNSVICRWHQIERPSRFRARYCHFSSSEMDQLFIRILPSLYHTSVNQHMTILREAEHRRFQGRLRVPKSFVRAHNSQKRAMSMFLLDPAAHRYAKFTGEIDRATVKYSQPRHCKRVTAQSFI